MIRGGEIAKGSVLLIKNTPHLVVERDFVNPGKGSAFCRCKLKNLRNGSVLTQTIKTQDTIEDAVVDTVDAQYQYTDIDYHYFMDTNTFDTIQVPLDLNENLKFYLKEGNEYPIVIWEENPIDVKIPLKMIFTVDVSENYIKGDTVSGATKPIVTETGLTVRVPLFIKQGEKIQINTETNDYLERVNK
ncbi:MAG TPA: elongation factor P [Treponemataceae bacterium]|nr:elongation factor P [Treponemataceae bacterium]